MMVECQLLSVLEADPDLYSYYHYNQLKLYSYYQYNQLKN